MLLSETFAAFQSLFLPCLPQISSKDITSVSDMLVSTFIKKGSIYWKVNFAILMAGFYLHGMC